MTNQWILLQADVYLKARGGAITEIDISLSPGSDASAWQKMVEDALRGTEIYKIQDFQKIFFGGGKANGRGEVLSVMGWLNKMFANPD